MHPTLEFAERSVKLHEGFSRKAYPDPANGRMLIGYGFDAGLNEISQEAATTILREKIASLTLLLHGEDSFFRELSPVRQAVLVEMAYQLGLAGFWEFRDTIALIRAGDYSGAAAEMLNSKWAREDTPKRAKLLSERFKLDRFF